MQYGINISGFSAIGQKAKEHQGFKGCGCNPAEAGFGNNQSDIKIEVNYEILA